METADTLRILHDLGLGIAPKLILDVSIADATQLHAKKMLINGTQVQTK